MPFLCQCNVCLRARARVIVDLYNDGITAWREQRDRINAAAQKECEEARAGGYVDPPGPFPRGIPA